MKTFRQILAENDDEFEYEVRSTANIHLPEKLGQIRTALLPYRVKSIEPGAYKVPSQTNKDFPNEPGAGVYVVKVVTGLPIPVENNNPVQIVAMNTRIHQSHLQVELAGVDKTKDADNKKGGDYKPMASTEGKFDATPDPEVADGQSKVGLTRLGEFIKQLQADRKERESETETKTVYESFATTHFDLEPVVGKPLRKGYYIVEAAVGGEADQFRVEGPFAVCPDNCAYRESALKDATVEVVSESRDGGRVMFDMKVTGYTSPARPSTAQRVQPVDRLYEVQVTNRDSGRAYNTVVRAASEMHARSVAVDQIARQYQVEAKTLVAVRPEAAAGRVVDQTV